MELCEARRTQATVSRAQAIIVLNKSITRLANEEDERKEQADKQAKRLDTVAEHLANTDPRDRWVRAVGQAMETLREEKGRKKGSGKGGKGKKADGGYDVDHIGLLHQQDTLIDKDDCVKFISTPKNGDTKSGKGRQKGGGKAKGQDSQKGKGKGQGARKAKKAKQARKAKAKVARTRHRRAKAKAKASAKMGLLAKQTARVAAKAKAKAVGNRAARRSLVHENGRGDGRHLHSAVCDVGPYP